MTRVEFLTTRDLAPTPTANEAYFDKIQLWLARPLDHATQQKWRRECGRGGIHIESKPARFNPQFRQKITTRQPSDKLLALIARRHDALINQVEIALEYLFDNLNDRDDAFAYLHGHLCRRWHGKRQQIKIVRGQDRHKESYYRPTRYDAGRWAPNVIAFYTESASRKTGELNCIHLEWRCRGVKAVRAAGIHSPADLLHFNQRKFWEKRLLLAHVDPERLGRLIRNQIDGTKSRTSPKIRYRRGPTFSLDQRLGLILLNAHYTIQELLDRYRSEYRIQRALLPSSIMDWLPHER